MTAQIAERLRYQGEEQALCTQPLSDYFAMGGNNPGFDVGCSALWRGYVGPWEIKADRLYPNRVVHQRQTVVALSFHGRGSQRAYCQSGENPWLVASVINGPIVC